ncbi:hypothetical protein TNCV_1007431 [Trichonephila clavipes]|nr:hypothetical protein TNCV_1007431 [Trichonephila clavipes]
MATGSYMTPIYSRSQSEVQGDLHKYTSGKVTGISRIGLQIRIGRSNIRRVPIFCAPVLASSACVAVRVN